MEDDSFQHYAVVHLFNSRKDDRTLIVPPQDLLNHLKDDMQENLQQHVQQNLPNHNQQHVPDDDLNNNNQNLQHVYGNNDNDPGLFDNDLHNQNHLVNANPDGVFLNNCAVCLENIK